MRLSWSRARADGPTRGHRGAIRDMVGKSSQRVGAGESLPWPQRGSGQSGTSRYLPTACRLRPSTLPGPRGSNWRRSRPSKPQVGAKLPAFPISLPPGPIASLQVSTVPRLPRPIPAFHQVSWEVSPTRMALLPPWDPSYEVKAGTRVLWVSWEPSPLGWGALRDGEGVLGGCG